VAACPPDAVDMNSRLEEVRGRKSPELLEKAFAVLRKVRG